MWRALLVLAITACGGQEVVRVKLEAHQPPQGAPTRLEIRAQVTGPQQGLRYRWFSVSGDCDPQESTAPETAFKFAEDAPRDRVSVQVWRDSVQVAQADVDLKLDARLLALAAERPAGVAVQITQVPPYEPYGGPNTRADIGGSVSGTPPAGAEVLVYARADAWYIQPMPNVPHALGPDGRWSTWTHTGSSYAALVVRTGAFAPVRLDVLPQVGGDVLARVVVEGVRR